MGKRLDFRNIFQLKKAIFTCIRQKADLLGSSCYVQVIHRCSAFAFFFSYDPSQALDALTLCGGSGQNNPNGCIRDIHALVHGLAGNQDSNVIYPETLQNISVCLVAHFRMVSSYPSRVTLLKQTVQLFCLVDSFPEDQDFFMGRKVFYQFTYAGNPCGCLTDQALSFIGKIHVF